jgi:hypothetical protein
MLDHLAFWYQVIIASEHLLGEAIFLLRDDGFEGALKAFYAKHLEDERHHAEWLKEDLGDHPINLHFGAAQLAGMSYYLVRHVHPVALMGYMQALEGKPIPMEYVESVEREHGISAARTLRIHAEEDPKHIAELLAFPVPDEWKPLVESTRVQTLKLLGGM